MFSHARLVSLREERGISRSDLHRALILRGLNRCRSLIDRWETGRSEPSATEVALLAAVLDVPIDRLFDLALQPAHP